MLVMSTGGPRFRHDSGLGFLEPAAAATTTQGPARSRSRVLLYAVMGAVSATLVVVLGFRILGSAEPPPLEVKTLIPDPCSVYRWFDAPGTVRAAGTKALTFASAGRVAEIVPVGTKFAAGETLALLEAGRRVRSDLLRLRERLAHAEITIAEKHKLFDAAMAALAKVAVIAAAPGEVAAVLVKVGDPVDGGVPAVSVTDATVRGVLALSSAEATAAHRLGYCRAEVEGKPVDCTFAAESGEAGQVALNFSAQAAALAGQTFRLARARYDAVFLVPASATSGSAGLVRVALARPDGKVELRPITVADRTAQEVVVSQGLDLGDAIILDPPPSLGAGTRVRVVQTQRQ